jgi:hypothetical protein
MYVCRERERERLTDREGREEARVKKKPKNYKKIIRSYQLVIAKTVGAVGEGRGGGGVYALGGGGGGRREGGTEFVLVCLL